MKEHPRLAPFRRMLEHIDGLDKRYAKVGRHAAANLADYLAGTKSKPSETHFIEYSDLKPSGIRRLGMPILQLAKHRSIWLEDGRDNVGPFLYYVQVKTEDHQPSEETLDGLLKHLGRGYRWTKGKVQWMLWHPNTKKRVWFRTVQKQGHIEMGGTEKDSLLTLMNDFFHQSEPVTHDAT
ncbi:hypothetical protein HY994_06665 [Candidatus Micrarchaeota archaeon]|nr:hypothetical protein [Candidatus Micrarchaeota archaeon]